MNTDNEQLKAMSDKVAHVLGHKLHHLSRGQEASLANTLAVSFFLICTPYLFSGGGVSRVYTMSTLSRYSDDI